MSKSDPQNPSELNVTKKRRCSILGLCQVMPHGAYRGMCFIIYNNTSGGMHEAVNKN